MLRDGRHREFEGLDHGRAWNKERGGKPEVVAGALSEFFLEPSETG